MPRNINNIDYNQPDMSFAGFNDISKIEENDIETGLCMLEKTASNMHKFGFDNTGKEMGAVIKKIRMERSFISKGLTDFFTYLKENVEWYDKMDKTEAGKSAEYAYKDVLKIATDMLTKRND